MWELFNLDLESQARDERGDLNKGRTDFTKRDFGDKFRSFITGVDEESLLDRTRELKVEDITENTLGDTSVINDNKGTLDTRTTINPGESEAQYKAHLLKEKNRSAALQKLRAMKKGSGLDVAPTSTSSDINSLMSGLVDSNEKATKDEARTETTRIEDRFDKRYYADKEAARADRRFQRQRDDSRNDLTLQLAMMDNQLADRRMAYDRETRAMDKRDRAIATLMSGLGSLGGAFSL